VGRINDLGSPSNTWNISGSQTQQYGRKVSLPIGMLVKLWFFYSQDEIW
jgi:hypothetical protein